jgi:hypothetical protein
MAACPKEISVDFIARLNRDYVTSVVRHQESEEGIEPAEG